MSTIRLFLPISDLQRTKFTFLS